MTTRLSINFAAGTIEVDGTEEFVDRIYTDLKETIIGRYGSIPIPSASSLSPGESNESGEEADDKPKRTRRKGKSTGPSCASRIQGLKDEGYFSDLRSATDVGGKLREKGTAYEGKHVAASLIDLVKRGVLRRVSQGGAWLYQNP